MSVGDVNSDARGSGARFNDHKAPLDLIPLEIVANSFTGPLWTEQEYDALSALRALGRFQTGRLVEEPGLEEAMQFLSPYWGDAARVFDYGRKKYAPWNWAKGMAWSIPLACAARHALAVLGGEELDSESNLPHVGHMLCNIVMLRTFVASYPEGDDLPPHGLFADRRAVVQNAPAAPPIASASLDRGYMAWTPIKSL